MRSVGMPDRAFACAALQHRGDGLARVEFIINRMIGVHPRALLGFARLEPALQATIRQHMAGYADPVSFYADRLSEGIAQSAAAFAPEPRIARLSDSTAKQYAKPLGRAHFQAPRE